MVRWFPGSEGRKAWGSMMVVGRVKSQNLPSLKLTAKAPENRPGPKRKQSYSNHPFSGAMLVLGRVGDDF